MRLKVIAVVSLTMLVGFLSAQEMYGAFQIKTEPKGASITFRGTGQYIGNTPSQVFPVVMDEYTTYNSGIPGRVISLVISKDGYMPLEQDIYVPFNSVNMYDAINNPVVLKFELYRYQTPPPIYIPRPCPPPVIEWNFHWPRPHHHYNYGHGWTPPNNNNWGNHGHHRPRPNHKP